MSSYLSWTLLRTAPSYQNNSVRLGRKLLTGVVGETPVHHGHVGVLRGQSGAPCRQQLLARRNPFDERLETQRGQKVRKEAAPAAQIWWFCGCSDLQAVVTLQAVIGSHHHVPVPPLPGLVKVKEVFFVQDLGLLTSFLSSTTQGWTGGEKSRLASPLTSRHLLHEQQRGLLLPLLQIIFHLQEASDGELPAVIRTEVLQLRLRLACSRTEKVSVCFHRA